MRGLISHWCGYDRVRKVVTIDPDQGGLVFFRRISEEFGIRGAFKWRQDLRNVRSTVFMCSHHTGAVDFVAAYPELADRAPNLKVVVNQALMSLEPLSKIAIAVHPVSAGIRNREAREEMLTHLRQGGNLLIFPAGKVGKRVAGEVEDSPWRHGISEVVLEAAEQVVPVLIQAKNGRFFYWVRDLFPRLSMLFLLRSLHRPLEAEVPVWVGEPISREDLQGLGPRGALDHVRVTMYGLPTKRNEMNGG
jgi:putative hemolysin